MAIKANQGKPRPSITPKTDEQRARTKELAKENKIKRENSDGETKENTGISKPPEESKAGFSKVTEDIEQDPKKLEQKKAGEQEKRAHDRRKLEANFKGEDRRIKDTSDRRIAGPASGQSGNNSLQIQGVSEDSSKKISQAGPEESSQNSQPRSKSDPGPQLKRQEGNRELLARPRVATEATEEQVKDQSSKTPIEIKNSLIRGKYTENNGVKHRTPEQKAKFFSIVNFLTKIVKMCRDNGPLATAVRHKNKDEVINLIKNGGAKNPFNDMMTGLLGSTPIPVNSEKEFLGIVAEHLINPENQDKEATASLIEALSISIIKEIKKNIFAQVQQFTADSITENTQLTPDLVSEVGKRQAIGARFVISKIVNTPDIERKAVIEMYVAVANDLVQAGDLDSAKVILDALNNPSLKSLFNELFGRHDKNQNTNSFKANKSFLLLSELEKKYVSDKSYIATRDFCGEKYPLPMLVIAKDKGALDEAKKESGAPVDMVNANFVKWRTQKLESKKDQAESKNEMSVFFDENYSKLNTELTKHIESSKIKNELDKVAQKEREKGGTEEKITAAVLKEKKTIEGNYYSNTFMHNLQKDILTNSLWKKDK